MASNRDKRESNIFQSKKNLLRQIEADEKRREKDRIAMKKIVLKKKDSYPIIDD
jgi:hypothetical protein